MNAVATLKARPPLAGRYRLGPVIGIGGFGTVFEAFDEVTRSRVAVKSLRQLDPQRLFCFKQEFRLLADCRHRNLVRYYELFQERERWYLAMEHVDGVDLMSHVRGAETPAIDSTTMTHSVSVEMPWEPGAQPAKRPALADRQGEVMVASEREIQRIRALLPQLGDGLEHLHANNLVHRDLTPRNIMVGHDGRLVILDFGLALRGTGTSMMRNLRVGTPKYMAPEQVSSEPSTPAADWYAIGSILYEMLTGIAPFVGSSNQILADKRSKTPVDPRQLYRHLPDDLCQLAMDCLALDPLQRPVDGVERLRACAVATTTTRAPTRAPSAVPFVGRGAQLDQLDQVWRNLVKDRTGTVVLLRGPSGMGKSALVDRFVSRLPPNDHLLLRSRCYQHESVPFKALDGLADALGEYLQDIPEEELAQLLPDGLQYLARLFPALRMIPRIQAKVEADTGAQPDPHEQRRRGFQALRALFHRLTDGRQMVITIDDIQWGDEDSLAALTEVLAPPGAPPVLVIASGRTEDGGGQVLDRMAQVFGAAGIAVAPLEVGPLSPQETAELAGSLLVGDGAPAEIDVAYRDSGGHPLYLRELVLAQVQSSDDRPSLRDLLTKRLQALDAPARRLVEATAVAGRPRTLALLHHAVGDIGNLAAAVHQLGAERLVRLRTALGRDELGVYHDKVAETAIALLSPEQLVSHHAALATALQDNEDPEQEAEALSMHLLAAGDRAGGWRYGIIAADRAAAALAFDRAAALYGKLLAIIPPEVDRSAFLMKMADALANAGHGVEAAKAYAEAAGNPAFTERLHALQRAAGQYLRSGYMDDGLAIAKQVLGEVGLKWHESSLSALLSLLMRRTWLRLRGLAFKEQDPASIPRSQRIKMDALWSLGHGLGGVDTVRGAEFHIRHLHLALQAGDPYRIGRGLAWESILNAAEGGAGGRRRGRAQVALGHDIAKGLHNEHAAAWSWAAEGYNNWCDAKWDDAIACNEKAARGYREECLDITWEVGSVYAWCWGPVLCYSGRLKELRQLVSQVEREFGQLNDLYTLVTLRTVVTPWLTLADGDPERARRESAEAVAQWSKKHWHLQHLFDRMADARVALYQGDGARAADLLDDGWPRYKSTMQNLLQVKRMFMHGLRGQAVIMAVMQGRRDASALKVAEADAKRLAKEGTAWASSYAMHLRAALHLARGDNAAAADGYRASIAAFEQLKMPLHAAAARIRLGQVAGDTRALGDGIAALTALGVKEPERYAATLVAGPAPR